MMMICSRCTNEKMDLQRLMQQAQKMQREMGKIQAELEEKIYEGNTGGSEEGVTVKVSGKNEVVEVVIADALMDPENKDMLQDMILIAVNDALTKCAAEREEKLGSLTQGMNIPGLR